jgi:hypothetical protein
MAEAQVGITYHVYGEVAREELGIYTTKVVYVDPSKVDAGWLQRMRDAGRVVESESAPEAHSVPVVTDLLPSACPVCESTMTGYKAHRIALAPSCTAGEHQINRSE